MKFCSLLAIATLFFLKSYSQKQQNLLIGFFVSGFNNDSVHVFLNEKKIMDVRLRVNPSLGQCDEVILAKMTDSIQSLTIFEVATQKKFQTVIKKGFRYLYMYKLNEGNCQFEYSNKLSLPQ